MRFLSQAGWDTSLVPLGWQFRKITSYHPSSWQRSLSGSPGRGTACVQRSSSFRERGRTEMLRGLFCFAGQGQGPWGVPCTGYLNAPPSMLSPPCRTHDTRNEPARFRTRRGTTPTTRRRRLYQMARLQSPVSPSDGGGSMHTTYATTPPPPPCHPNVPQHTALNSTPSLPHTQPIHPRHPGAQGSP